jgi:oligoribonuclease
MIYVLLADLETTGLNPVRCQVIEVAARILVPGKELARFHAICKAPSVYEETWEEKAKQMHLDSGLLNEAMEEGRAIDVVDDELRKLIDIHVPEGEPVYLMGNSVHFDRSFMAVHMKRTRGRLHYRILDVSSIRLWFHLMSGHDPLDWEKEGGHRAQGDIEATLDEAIRYWKRR